MKYIFLFISSFSFLMADLDSSGWAQLERPSRYVEDEMGDEEGVWVVFSKEMEKEKFTVRFPKDPIYYYSSEGIEISSSKNSEKFHLFVHKNLGFSAFEERLKVIETIPDVVLVKAFQVSSDTFSLLYQIEGKWVSEHLFISPNHVYTLQTFSDDPFSENHHIFVDSLYVKSQF